MTVNEYKKEITSIFNHNSRNGFADWRQCGSLERSLTGFLEQSSRELEREGRYKDLFDITCRAFVKWSNTDKDDSNGETQSFVRSVFDIWDSVYERGSQDISHNKMFEWFMGKLDSSLIDYMENYLLDYVMEHFQEPHLLDKKLTLLESKIQEQTEKAKEESWRIYSVEGYQRMVMQVFGEQGRPIEMIREYAKKLKGDKARELLADIELRYGNTDQAIAIYEALADDECRQAWGRHEYNLKLKDLYKSNGFREKYEVLLERLLYLETGSDDILTEYKALIPPENWGSVRDSLFNSFSANNYRALPWYASEKCYDRLMDGVEAAGYHYLKQFEKLLGARYPERCLEILVRTAEEDSEQANNRKDYQHLARVLRWMQKYPRGPELASELAERFRAAYPRKRALIEELENF